MVIISAVWGSYLGQRLIRAIVEPCEYGHHSSVPHTLGTHRDKKKGKCVGLSEEASLLNTGFDVGDPSCSDTISSKDLVIWVCCHQVAPP